jgi:predicted HTH domain antitoxin
MARPTKAEREKMKITMQGYVDRDMSLSEIARLTGKTSQAVHQFLTNHGIKTKGMTERQKKNLDKDAADQEDADETTTGEAAQ